MNTATRGIVLTAAAVVLGAIILSRGFDDPTSAIEAGDTSEEIQTVEGPDTSEEGATSSEDADPTSTGTDTPPGSGETASSTGNGDTSTAEPPPTGDTEHPPEEVRVLVANDTTTGGLGSQVRDRLTASAGYNGLTPVNSTTQGSGAPTVVYFAEGYRADAAAIATILGLDPAGVTALPAQPPVEDLNRADVLIVVGPDLVPAA